MQIDLNADIGEGFGEDLELLESISSANIACGQHAGDPSLMQITVQNAISQDVALGAHPGLPDRANFGRIPMSLSGGEVAALLRSQLGALQTIVERAGSTLHHVKPHGALYHMADSDKTIAEALCHTVLEFDPNLVLYARSGGLLARTGEAAGLSVAHEVFADRLYEPDGTLTPRTAGGAVVHRPETVVGLLLALFQTGEISARDGSKMALRADTVCIHGDEPGAGKLAASVRRSLKTVGVDCVRYSTGRAK